jgi:wyosine [tRNA(Phe)-imidazoG37] synthetase (radical SAM superfamily)
MKKTPPSTLLPAHRDHRRDRGPNLYIYPAISRRSHGLSVGVNLNPDKICNFDCIYCEVNRAVPPRAHTVDLAVLETELREMMTDYQSGRLFGGGGLSSVPEPLRRMNDIAFSGDGEPTAPRNFGDAVDVVARVKQETVGRDVKIVLITNATHLGRADVKHALQVLDANEGEIWAKLDAGTESHYQTVNRSAVQLGRILKNIEETAKVRPICVQSMFLRVHGHPPPQEEIEAYLGHLRHFIDQGCKIKEVQVYSVARPTPEDWATALPEKDLRQIGHLIHQRTGLKVECYPGWE